MTSISHALLPFPDGQNGLMRSPDLSIPATLCEEALFSEKSCDFGEDFCKDLCYNRSGKVYLKVDNRKLNKEANLTACRDLKRLQKGVFMQKNA